MNEVAVYVYFENSDYACGPEVWIYKDAEEAIKLMEEKYEEKLEMLGHNLSVETDDYYAYIDDEDCSAIIVEGMNSYYWSVSLTEPK